MISFAEAKTLVISRLQQRVGQALMTRSRSGVCDTGKGGAEHSYQVEANRRLAAQSDAAASREADKWRSWIQSVEKLQSFEQYLTWLSLNLKCVGWKGFTEGYEIDFADLKTPFSSSKTYLCDIVDTVQTVHKIMVKAAPPAPSPLVCLRQAYRRMRVAAKPVRRLVNNPNQVSSAVLPAVQGYLPSLGALLSALKAISSETKVGALAEGLEQWHSRINDQRQTAEVAVAAAIQADDGTDTNLNAAAYQAFAALFNSCVDGYDEARQAA